MDWSAQLLPFFDSQVKLDNFEKGVKSGGLIEEMIPACTVTTGFGKGK